MSDPVIDEDGNRRWYKNGELHRTDGPAVERADGSDWWYKNGELHRTDGPAVELTDGTTMWYVNGKIHRTDGPAIERVGGAKRWFIHGDELTFGKWCNATNKTPQEITLLVLRHEPTCV